jgi:hypothetical protein
MFLAGVPALFVCGTAAAKLPSDYKEFKARCGDEGRTMEGAVKLYFEAVFCYLNKDTRIKASKMLRYSLRQSALIENTTALRTFVYRMKDESYHHIFRSYAVGATPENSCNVLPGDFKLNSQRVC